MVDADGDLLDDDAWRAHLFRTRGGQRIVRWARSLRWFRYCRGHASPFFTEPDRFLVALRWDGADRHAVLAALGLAEGADGWQDLAGGRVRVEPRPDRLVLAVFGGEQRRTALTERDLELAFAVEALLEPLADRVIDPPLDDGSCVSPARYPSVFAAS